VSSADLRPLSSSNRPVDLDAAIASALDWSSANQETDGHWVGRLESNCCMEAQWILALHFVGWPDHPVRDELVRAVLREQRPDGSWEVFRDAPAGDINTTVECYVALRSAGHSKDDERLTRARKWIENRGGLGKVRVFTRYWLATIGVWPWEKTPNLPPEIVYAPRWFTFSIYNFASWARATLMPLAILSARRPVRPLPGGDRLDELFPEGREAFDWSLPDPPRTWSWENVFLGLDRVLHALQKAELVPGRESTLARVMDWIVSHQDADGVWGGIQPPWIYSVLALHTMGWDRRHPVMAAALGALQDPRWRVRVEDASYMSASVSPVWDTVLTLLAIEDCDAVDRCEEDVVRAVDWLLDQQVLADGDWSVKVTDAEPGGWAFEYENLKYPDIDDTAVALFVLARLRDDPRFPTARIEAAISRAEQWVRAMQCSRGGWAAFDKDNDRQFLTKIPFCDFGEVLDPPSVDVTAHVVEAFASLGYGLDDPAIRRAVDWIWSEQEADGAWFGRWGVNYIYGTGAVLPALKAIGEDMSAPLVQKAADWLVAHQAPDGGWGESCSSYMDPSMKGRGTSTASQTAWALIGLNAVGRPTDESAVERGLQWLVDRQVDGSWKEPEYTGTGFPGYGVGLRVRLDDPGLEDRLAQGIELSRAFMINYNLYRHYFPLIALGRVRSSRAR